MRRASLIVSILLLTAPLAAAPASKTYVGTITDSMCIKDHSAMGVTPADKCVRECAKHSANKLVLVVDGNKVYTLSDQETPLKFAAQKVKVTGVLYEKTNVLKVESIEAVK